MSGRELSSDNYRRISLINWSLSIPLAALFAWPYIYLSQLVGVTPAFWIPGSILFAMPFSITILHGHVTMALGSAHRDYYYTWLLEHPRSFGLVYRPMLIRTRFRLSLIYASGGLMVLGWILR